MTPEQQYLQSIGWTGTEEDFYRSKNMLPAAEPPKPPAAFDYKGYFNPDYYTSHNPDVKAAGVDPLQHYETYGWHEGRDPSDLFDTSDYLGQYADIVKAGVNPLQHYIQYGMSEGRFPKIFPDNPLHPDNPNNPINKPQPPQPPSPPPPPNRGDVSTQARGSIKGYFQGRGVDAEKYNQQIMDSIAAKLAGVADADLGQSGLFTGVGEDLYSQLTGQYRNQARSAFDLANQGVDTTPYESTFDDQVIEQILDEQRMGADSYINTLLGRGQITDPNAQTARTDLDRQEALGRTKLNTLGGGILDRQNTAFGTKQSSRRSALDTLDLDRPYDVGTPDMDTLGNEFMLSLGKDLRRNQQGPGVIFNTSNLPGIGAQGPTAGFSAGTPFAARSDQSPHGRTPGGVYQEIDERQNQLF